MILWSMANDPTYYGYGGSGGPSVEIFTPSIDDDLAEVHRAHDFDSPDAPYQPEVSAMARAAERLADEVERLRGLEPR